MKRVKGYLLTLVVLAACPTWHSSKAMINAGAGWWCDEGYTWDDYTLTLQQVLVNCTWAPPFMYGPEPPLDPPISGNGSASGSNTPPFPTLAISQKLDCALQKYADNRAPKAGMAIKRVDKWAFVKPSGAGWVYIYRNSPSSPGTEWRSAGGMAYRDYYNTYDEAHLFNAAFQGSANFDRAGRGPTYGVPGNEFSGPISDFEMSLFAGAHELAHLHGLDDDVNDRDEKEEIADWFGIFAVLNYRADGGSQCSGVPD